MTKNILILQAHPDPQPNHFGHALAQAYTEGAEASRHVVRQINLAGLTIPFLRNRDEWQSKASPEMAHSMKNIEWADHIVIIYPLWLGDMPALLKAFLEQVMRPGFAVPTKPTLNGGLLKGKSARVIVTMGMPGWFYRWYFGAHSLKSLRRNILHFVGIAPVRETIIGMVEGKPEKRHEWLKRISDYGRKAS